MVLIIGIILKKTKILINFFLENIEKIYIVLCIFIEESMYYCKWYDAFDVLNFGKKLFIR